MSNTFKQENMCLNKVADISADCFSSKFIPFTGDIDNGIDGVILWRENNTIIDSIYVQCKGGDSYLPKLTGKNYDQPFKLNLPKDYVKKHYPVWKSASGPIILVVCNSRKKAWWVNLKSSSTYNEACDEIWCQPENRFNKSAYYPIRELVRQQKYLNGRATISVKGQFLHGVLENKPLKEIAHDYYRTLSNLPSNHPDLDGTIEFSRVGWRHILRKSRRKSRILQSLLLLPLIPDIIRETEDYVYLSVEKTEDEDGNTILFEKLGIQAECLFNYRFPSIVQIILIRKRIPGKSDIKDRIWFYSIYEMSRNQKITDVSISI